MDQTIDVPIADDDRSPSFTGRKKRSKASNDEPNVHSRLLDSHIKIALSLYKVQQNIYLLDFQRVEVGYLSFQCAFSVSCQCHDIMFIVLSGRCLWVHETMRIHYYGTEKPVCCIQS